ncbi:transposase, partial [Mycobacterium rufum]|nr:transposase [Mycolicibacterium rufum]
MARDSGGGGPPWGAVADAGRVGGRGDRVPRRDRYQRTAAAPGAQPGSRNGYRAVTVKTTAGPVTLERPKLRGTTAAFASRLFGKNVTKTNALESLVIASFVRGLSVRDVEATLADALGDQAAISKSTVSQV